MLFLNQLKLNLFLTKTKLYLLIFDICQSLLSKLQIETIMKCKLYIYF